ncbi:hypothetical protein A3F00_03475 [Candidatus Daviesbacteria bacterium RIFCSPHIGHO2_12_FULL_37_11]|uniref:Uncharacterized protein n=1 Tax=Candidatus Daviesbacteria bacterium RIFCSPHIGHO2_12_FULL_37_11 TaxID=1797777 RepID=A0A1F5KCM4_9BACT|nr:MAG: hypothetical protein A2111_00760 [Candidatus Daviesbacteria bacterium GWA1_38_6]OGE18026.1 MAG: hypothetical protein A2769_01165 [Candidatus Daviesbacteria bacterium RIFCSPHIGHO2_01_FULL_37_27]OGE38702.1 MAG: hypothetical protein A3F00_03475 [Candidatus Daviesbacteria bacterium RIFCSPHIGHO2_12_FULL_37_11]
MTRLILKIIPALFSWGIFVYVILNVPYPESLTRADSFQLLSFFIPFFLSLIFSINLALNNILRSIFISFGIIILLVLKALDSLNLVSTGLTVLAVILLLSYFKRSSHLTPIKSGLTSGSFIPKLTRWQKRHLSS